MDTENVKKNGDQEFQKNHQSNDYINVDKYVKKYTLEDDKIKFNMEELYNLNNDELNWEYICPEINVSTLVINCKLGTKINLRKIAYYFDFKNTKIQYINYSAFRPHRLAIENNEYVLLKKKKKRSTKSKKQKKRPDFDNQITLVFNSEEKKNETKKEGIVNVKLFKNGTLHLTGCKRLSNFIEILCAIYEYLKDSEYIMINGKLNEIKYFENIEDICVRDIRVEMINSNFEVFHEIDRMILHNILLENNACSTYDSCEQHGVNINYKIKNPSYEKYMLTKDDITEVSEPHIIPNEFIKCSTISIFESGRIIATGAKNFRGIMLSHKFICDFLKDNYDKIKKTDYDQFVNVNSVIYKKNIEYYIDTMITLLSINPNYTDLVEKRQNSMDPPNNINSKIKIKKKTYKTKDDAGCPIIKIKEQDGKNNFLNMPNIRNITIDKDYVEFKKLMLIDFDSK